MSNVTKKYFVVANWYAWVIEANQAGYSATDIRFILGLVGVLDRMRETLGKQDAHTNDTGGA
jgi:hypothetical protein